MVCVWPPHTSISLYWRPGSHRAMIFAASACAVSASRNSSTKRIVGLLFDLRVLQRGKLVLVGLPDALQERQRRGGLGLVDLGQREPDVDQDPLAGLRRIVGE